MGIPDNVVAAHKCVDNHKVIKELININELKIFNYKEHTVRTVARNGEPWFVLKDVCRILGLGTPARVAERLEKDEVSLAHLTDSIGRNQETTIISEAGIYSVVLRSDKQEAKPFKRWVTHEVLPAIRKHGGYLTPEKIEEALLNPDTIIRLATELKSEREKRLELEEQSVRDKPKVIFADAVAASHTSILIGDLAKLIRQNGVEIGQNRLFKWLRDNKYLCSLGERYNLPSQRSMDMGLFEVKETAINNPDGSVRVTRTTKVTGKGQAYFVNKFLGEKKEAVQCGIGTS